MQKAAHKKSTRNYPKEQVQALQDIAKALNQRRTTSQKALNRASDIRAVGNAIVIGLVVEQAFHQVFDVKKAVAGTVFMALAWIISQWVEREGGVE